MYLTKRMHLRVVVLRLEHNLVLLFAGSVGVLVSFFALIIFVFVVFTSNL